MKKAIHARLPVIFLVCVLLCCNLIFAQDQIHIRGEITKIEDNLLTVATRNQGTLKIRMRNNTSIFKLSKASFTEVDFGVYVGAVSRRLEEFSPIVRDSMSWLHQGYELRIMDEDLRGLALGHSNWDLTSESVISHGWVDDLEIRVLSIKYGPTEEEETDVDIPRDVTIARMSIGDKELLEPKANVFIGAMENGESLLQANYIMVGYNGLAPAL